VKFGHFATAFKPKPGARPDPAGRISVATSRQRVVRRRTGSGRAAQFERRLTIASSDRMGRRRQGLPLPPRVGPERQPDRQDPDCNGMLPPPAGCSGMRTKDEIMKLAILRTLSTAALIGLAATGAMAQNYNVPLSLDADSAAAPIQSDRMLAALARVPVGEYTNNEMLRIAEARKDGDTGLLNFYLSHTNRLVQTRGVTEVQTGPVNPMTADDPNAN
jgi:hypothetical protein